MLIEDMVRIPSPTGATDGIVDYLIAWAGENGFRARRDESGNFVAEKGAGQEILLVGHIDTVPGDIPVKMENGKLHGRGASDAKGPMACFLEAAARVEGCRLVVVGTIDEEAGSRGAKSLIGKYEPGCVIVGEPSGWSNINIGYKGRLVVRYSSTKPKEHGSGASQNTCEEAVQFYNAAKSHCDSFNTGKSVFGALSLRLASLETSDDGLEERAEMSLCIRTLPGFDIERLKSELEGRRGTASLSFSDYEEPVKAGKDNRLVSEFMREIRKSGGEVAFKLKCGTSDMNVLQKFSVPIVTYGPGDSALDHTPRECLDLGEYRKAREVLVGVLSGLGGKAAATGTAPAGRKSGPLP